MNPSGRHSLGVGLLTLLPFFPPRAQGVEIEPDARSNGMGRAYTAVAEGPAAVWWNAGALGLARGMECTPVSFRQLVPDLADDVWIYSAGVTVGHDDVGFGLHFSRVSYGKTNGPNGTFSSSENTLHVGAGLDLIPLLSTSRGGSRAIEWGVGGSWVLRNVNLAPEGAIPDALGGSAGDATAWDFDLGTLFVARFPFPSGTRPQARNWVGLRAGTSWSSIFGKNLDFSDSSSPLPQRVRMAGGIEAGILGTSFQDPLLRVLFTFEQEEFVGEFSAAEGIFYFGGETVLSVPVAAITYLVALRFGAVDDDAGEIDDATYGFGVGFGTPLGPRALGITFDYARVPQAFTFPHTHHFTLGVRLTP